MSDQAFIYYHRETGEVFTYQRGDTRIRGNHGTEINVWDHATGQPGILFNGDAIQTAIEQWYREETGEDQQTDQPTKPAGQPFPGKHPTNRTEVGTVRVADGYGCSERLPAWMADDYRGDQ